MCLVCLAYLWPLSFQLSFERVECSSKLFRVSSHFPKDSGALSDSSMLAVSCSCWACGFFLSPSRSRRLILDAGRLGVIYQHINNMNLVIHSESQGNSYSYIPGIKLTMWLLYQKVRSKKLIWKMHWSQVKTFTPKMSH